MVPGSTLVTSISQCLAHGQPMRKFRQGLLLEPGSLFSQKKGPGVISRLSSAERSLMSWSFLSSGPSTVSGTQLASVIPCRMNRAVHRERGSQKRPFPLHTDSRDPLVVISECPGPRATPGKRRVLNEC